MNESTDTDDLTENDKFYVEKKILKECYDLYADPNKGLSAIGMEFGLRMSPVVKKKITVLLIGDTCTGKSSFINWYVGEDVRKTGRVASEREKICLVTSGKRRQSLMGKATLHILQLLCPIPGITKDSSDHYLSTEISASNQKHFGLVAFVDTPGSEDPGSFDKEEYSTILKIGNTADLIFVFLDPTRQTLSGFTSSLLCKLTENYENLHKLRLCLSKADEAGDESDRERAITQIIKQLNAVVRLSTRPSAIRTIYIPELNKATECPNQIEEICDDIEDTVSRTIQIRLDRLQSDCNLISELIQSKLDTDRADGEYNNVIISGAVCVIVVIFALGVWVILSETISVAETVGAIFGLLLLTLFFSFFCSMIVLTNPSLNPLRDVLSPMTLVRYMRKLSDVDKVKQKKDQLYLEYLKQSLSDYDLSN